MRKYELATSLHFRYDRSEKIPITHEIERLSFCGFKNLDFNFLDMCLNENSHFMREEGYIEWIAECRKTADFCGAKFVQAHAPCESVLNFHNYESLKNLCIKAIRGCAELGIPWMVYHVIVDGKYRFGFEDDFMSINKRFFSELLPYAKEYSVGIAIENIVPFNVNSVPSKSIDELIELIDSFDSEYVGACWDFGHANLCNVIKGAESIADQSEQLVRLGDRLKATHVHDNNSRQAAAGGIKISEEDYTTEFYKSFDNHIQPFMGDIDWADVIKGLDAIDYSHYFTFEAHHAANTLPESIVNQGLIQLRRVGESIINMSKR